jgi:hypothetical protein
MSKKFKTQDKIWISGRYPTFVRSSFPAVDIATAKRAMQIQLAIFYTTFTYFCIGKKLPYCDALVKTTSPDVRIFLDWDKKLPYYYLQQPASCLCVDGTVQLKNAQAATNSTPLQTDLKLECFRMLSFRFENRVLRRIFGPKRDEVTGEWRRLHNKELYALYSSPVSFG